MADDKQGKFKLIGKTAISDVVSGKIEELQESDLAFQDEGYILQYEYLKPDEEELQIIKPGIYSFEDAPGGLRLKRNRVESKRASTDSI